MDLYNDEIWVFLSHSHDDYEKVLKVRDLLEKDSYRPIMFFLRCLEKDDEVDELIKREIDARKRFILCDSKNARNSKWVQREIEYIKSQNRLYETIDLDSPIEKIEEALHRFKRRSTVYVRGYSNTSITSALYKALGEEEFRIFHRTEERNVVKEKYRNIRKDNGLESEFLEGSLGWLFGQAKTITALQTSTKEGTIEWAEKTKELCEIEDSIWNSECEELAEIDKIANLFFDKSKEDGYVIYLLGKKEFHPKHIKRMERLFESLEDNMFCVIMDPVPDNISKHLKDLIKNNPPIEVFNLSIDNAINKIISYIRCLDMKLYKNR